mmetsp:Transcript_4969/g.11072  ORF Transcript_4969/g.11072 Transcript_4969/m.11072 type:complete len:244 (-) Transcript_4969:4361-5092(-)
MLAQVGRFERTTDGARDSMPSPRRPGLEALLPREASRQICSPHARPLPRYTQHLGRLVRIHHSCIVVVFATTDCSPGHFDGSLKQLSCATYSLHGIGSVQSLPPPVVHSVQDLTGLLHIAEDAFQYWRATVPGAQTTTLPLLSRAHPDPCRATHGSSPIPTCDVTAKPRGPIASICMTAPRRPAFLSALARTGAPIVAAADASSSFSLTFLFPERKTWLTAQRLLPLIRARSGRLSMHTVIKL